MASLELESEQSEEEFVPADLAAPEPSARETVELSEEAKAKAELLLEGGDAPSEAASEEVFGTLTVFVTDEAGLPLADHFVLRSNKGPGNEVLSTKVYSDKTDATGRARWKGLVIGQHEVAVRRSRVSREPFVRRLLFELNPGMDERGYFTRTIREGAETEVHIVYPNLHALAGTVTDQGAPLADVMVRLYEDSEVALNAEADVRLFSAFFASELSARTDLDGKFRFEELTRGRYTISVERPSGGMRQLWDLTLPDHSSSIDLQLDSLSVYGIVTDADGLPVAGAQLAVERVRVDEFGIPRRVEQEFAGKTLHSAGVTDVVESAADGSYRITGVDGSSPLVVVARSPWMETTRSQVFGFARGESEQAIDLTLSPSGRVAVRLNAESWIGRFVRVIATPLDHGGAAIIGSTYPGASQLRLLGLRPGRYSFGLYFYVDPSSSVAPFDPLSPRVWTDGPLPEAVPVEAEVLAGETLQISLTLP